MPHLDNLQLRRFASPASNSDVLTSITDLIFEPTSASQPVTKLYGTVALGMASVILSIGSFSYVAISGHNSHLIHNATTHAVPNNAAEMPKDPNISAPGAVPDEKPISPAAVAAHIVAPNEPRLLKIKKLNIVSRVVGLSTTSKGELQAPHSIFDTGWYQASAKPGQGGAVLIDGHSTGLTKEGVFSNLSSLAAGDKITIERGDGKVTTYVVVKSKLFPAGAVDMVSAILPVTPGKAGLNLITCAGIADIKNFSYSDRLIVYAEQI